VAQVVRDGLARRQRLATVCRAAASVLEACAMALARSQDRAAIRSIPQQVTALLDNTAGLEGEADEELADILLRLRFVALYYLIELGDSASQAIAIGESLTADLERLLGPDHPDTLNSRNSLASAYLAVGRAAEAIPLFQQTLAVRQRLLGPDDPDILTSQNNLAAAYQDDGRATEAIHLYEHTLAVRERLLGADHPSALTSRGNLAAALQNAGRAAEAIPLLEQTLAGRERVLGPGHPDTGTSRINLAHAYRYAGRDAEAIPLFERALGSRKRVLGPGHRDTRTSPKNVATAYWDGGLGAKGILPVERTPAARENQPAADAAEQVSPASLRRPPADPVRRVLPTDFRRPPVDPVRRLRPDNVASPSAKRTRHSSPGLPQHSPSVDVPYDRDVVAAVRAGDRAGIAMAYDNYAAALYGYCHWMLHDSADAAGALEDTFVIATATLSDLAEPSELRPWLFALARNECRRRIRTTSATRDEAADAANQQVDTDQRADAAGQPIDATMPFRAIGQPIDATVSFRAVSQPIDVTYEPIDATMPFRVVSQLTDVTYEPIDATMPFRVVNQLTDATYKPTDATMPFRMVSQSVNATDGPGHVDDERKQAELRNLTHSILAELRPPEREVIELSFRHDLYDNDLAIALGVSWRRAHALASRARSRLETALDALLIALTRREACAELGEMLADWDGQLNKRTRDLVGLHLVQCEACADHGHGALRPEAFSRLLPSATLPPRLREQVLSRCFSTAEDAVEYRRWVARRAASTWFGRISETMSWTWDSIRASSGATIAALAVALWAVAAVSVTLVTVTGSNAHAQVAEPSVRTSSSSPAAAVNTTVPAVGPASAPASPSRSARPSPTYVEPTYVPSASSTLNTEPSLSSSPSRSPKPSPSKSPKPSKSPSPSPSPSSSGSPSPSKTP
jgi:RNA polymerase sigma factor (sigma-70 family)